MVDRLTSRDGRSSTVAPLLRFAAELVPAYLTRQRWYPAKDAGIPEVVIEAAVPIELPGIACVISIWSATPPGRAAIRLFMPIAVLAKGALPSSHPGVIGPAPPGDASSGDESAQGILVDAFTCDSFVRAFVRLMVESDAAALAGLRSDRSKQGPDAGGSLKAEACEIRRGSVEQSNTSIRIGAHRILKVIRKIEAGVHPELEMGQFLTDRAQFAATPRLLAWINLENSTIALLQSFVPNQGDGWNWILECLRRGTPDRRAIALRWIRRLGEATGDLHLALAARSGDRAFEPEPAAPEDWQRWLHDVESMAGRARDGLNAVRGALDAEGQTAVEKFDARFAGLKQSLRALLPGPGSLVKKTRHHGDFHLGQVLVQGGDGSGVVIVDFEGEPLRPLIERRAKHIPLRDVAGMLRSFAYAAAVVEREWRARTPAAVSAEGAHPEASLAEWGSDAATVFLEAYFAKAGGAPGCPSDRSEALRLVQFFTIEKALYEVMYELANRPDWIAIPLRALTELSEFGGAASSGVRTSDTQRDHPMPHGSSRVSAGGVQFRLWAPGCERIQLELYAADGKTVAHVLPMSAKAEGWHDLIVPGAAAGTRYRFVLPDGLRVPDPASRFQPDDVHGPSEVIDPAQYRWQDGEWAGRAWPEAVIYELHVGTFTPEGTFRAAIGRLGYLAELGITAIEIMPIADFPGGRNWGYDGVLLYAPDSSYGRPDDLRALVDEAHAHGMMVLLDVVYNHFGPDGNYLPVYAPAFFTDRHKTPWGAGVNFDGPHSEAVREFIIHNALYWIEEYHFDGLRLDAVHAILDDSAQHVLDELARRVRTMSPQAHLILENEENSVRHLQRADSGAPVLYTAQWNDDVHHVLHVAATGEDRGYYRDYIGDVHKLGRALAEGFAFQGEVMSFRGTPRGEPSSKLPSTAFIAFIQNHDQIGNRAFGERIGAITSAEALRAIAAVYILLPQVPMLFMGEEWAAAQPFPFFCDFDGELAEAVRTGRRLEFAKFPEFQDDATRARIPDPQAVATFESAKLRWSDLEKPEHAGWHSFYRDLLATRRREVIPILPARAGEYTVIGERSAIHIRWPMQRGVELIMAANLSAVPAGGFPDREGRILWEQGETSRQGTLGAWSVVWNLVTPVTAG